jgi:hypothetical protein
MGLGSPPENAILSMLQEGMKNSKIQGYHGGQNGGGRGSGNDRGRGRGGRGRGY